MCELRQVINIIALNASYNMGMETCHVQNGEDTWEVAETNKHVLVLILITLLVVSAAIVLVVCHFMIQFHLSMLTFVLPCKPVSIAALSNSVFALFFVERNELR